MRMLTAIGLAILALGCAGTPATGPAPADEAEAQAVVAAATGFYAALNAMFEGDAAPMAQVWSHADDVSYMGPAGGRQVGWSQVRAAWEEQAAMKLGGTVAPHEMLVTVGPDLAFTSSFERGENVDADGNLQVVAIRATNVFRKEDGQWKMIGHHTDPLPFLAE